MNIRPGRRAGGGDAGAHRRPDAERGPAGPGGPPQPPPHRGHGAGTGVFALAAVVAVAMAALGGTPAAPPVEPGPPPAPELLTVAMVSERASRRWPPTTCSTSSRRSPTGGATDTASGGSTRRPATRASPTWDGPRRGRDRDLWQVVRGDTLTMTDVSPPRAGAVPGSTAASTASITRPDRRTPDELRAALGRGDGYTLVGPADLDGQAVLHLRRMFEDGTDELWVDAQTYRAVRRETVKHTPDGDVPQPPRLRVAARATPSRWPRWRSPCRRLHRAAPPDGRRTTQRPAPSPGRFRRDRCPRGHAMSAHGGRGGCVAQ